MVFMIMKQALLSILFMASLWMIAVSRYALYECRLEGRGLGPISTFPFREGLIQVFNLAFPAAVLALFWLMKTAGSLGIRPEMFRLSLITVVLAAFLGFKAKQRAFPDPTDPMIARAIWWLPDPKPAQAIEIDDWE